MNFTEKLVIDLPEDGEAIEIRKGGQRVCAIAFRTTAAGNLQTIIYGAGTFGPGTVLAGSFMPVLAIGGDRTASDVQISPEPMERPPVHFNVHANIYQGTYGDCWIDGHASFLPRQIAFNASGQWAVPADPRGAISLGRTRHPQPNEGLGLIRLWRKDSLGVTREEGRIGLSADGCPFINGGGNDSPRLLFRFGADWAHIAAYNPSTVKTLVLGFDNSGALKCLGTNGTVTTIAPP